MKTIEAIVKNGKALAEKLFGINVKKIQRSVESHLDYADEMIMNAESKKLLTIQQLGENPESPEALKRAINAYCEALDEIEAWTKRKAQIEQLKKELNEEAPKAVEE